MGTAAAEIFTLAKQAHGSDPFVLELPEAASQSFVRGDPVYLVGGKVTVIASATQAFILGVAAQDASGVTNALVPVWIADDNNIFEGNLCGTSGANATGALSDIGQMYGIYHDTSNKRWMVDKSVTGANSRVVVVDIRGKDTTSGLASTSAPTLGAPAYQQILIQNATNTRVLFKFPASCRQLERTS